MLLSLMLSSSVSLAYAPTATQGAAPHYPVRTHVARQLELRQSATWQDFLAGDGQGWQATFDEWSGAPRSAWGPGIEMGPLESEAQVEAALRALFADNPGLTAVDQESLSFRNAGYDAASDTWHVHFDRLIHGVPVYRGGVQAVIKQGRLIQLQLATFPGAGFATDVAPLDAATAWDLTQEQVPHGALELYGHEARQVVLVMPKGSDGLSTRLCWELRSQSDSPRGVWVSLVDAQSGQLLYTWNDVPHLQGEIWVQHHERNPNSPQVESPASWAAVYSSQDSGYTSEDGEFNIDGRPVTTDFDGAWLDMRNSAGGSAEASFDSSEFLWTTDQATQAELDTWVFLHQIQRWGQVYAPTINVVAGSMQANVNIDDVCNAYYDPYRLSVNFYAESTNSSYPCNNTGQIADVAYHEWGHGFHHTSLVSGYVDNDLGEGVGDTVSFIQTNDHVMARYFMKNGSGIREVATDLVYPDDYINGDVHHNGLIFGGSAWDLLKLLEDDVGLERAQEVSSQLLADGIKSGPALTATYDAYLAADDDNGDLGDGTPHICELVEAFTPHGIGPGGTALLLQAAHVPVENIAIPETPISVEGQATNLAPDCSPSPDQGALHWSVDGGDTWESADLDLASDMSVAGEIPGQPAGTIVHYYLSFDSDGEAAMSPSGGVINAHSFLVGTTDSLYFQDFEDGEGGFTHELISGQDQQGADDWWLGTPAGLNGDPAYCFSGDSCFGNDLGGEYEGANWNGTYQANKHNRLSSPAIEIPAGEGQLFLQFRRWLNVEDGQFDSAQVLVDGEVVWSNYDGSSAVEDEDTLDNQWALVTLPIQDVDGDGYVQVSWDLISDAGKELGGWNVDDVEILRLSAEQPSEQDPDEAVGELEIIGAGNCGCASTTPTHPASLLGLLALGAGLLIRRRRD